MADSAAPDLEGEGYSLFFLPTSCGSVNVGVEEKVCDAPLFFVCFFDFFFSPL